MKKIFAVLLLSACAHVTRVQMEPLRFQALPSGEVVVQEPNTLFQIAGEAFAAKKYDEAVALYDELVEKFPGASYVLPSYYNAGLALEAKGDFAAAAERYRRLLAVESAKKCIGSLQPAPQTPAQTKICDDVLDAQFRLGTVYGELKNFGPQADVYKQILERKGLSLADRMEAQARRGAAQVGLKDFTAAELTLREQLDYYRAHEFDERLESDFFVGMAAFYLAQVTHEQYRLLPIRLPEKQMALDLEAKAQLVLMAQHRYLDTIRVRNPEWATAAGFQIGSLYREFYDDLVNAPVPPQLEGEARQVYLEEVRKKVRTLLEKAISIHEKNVLMAERVGVANDWVKRSNDQMDQLKQLILPGAKVAPAAEPSQPPPLPERPVIKDVPKAPVSM